MTLRFAAESVIKTLSFDKLDKIQKGDRELKRSIHKFKLKMAHIPDSPLDYILSLPKKVYTTLLERTREKMLYENQDDLMAALQEKKANHKKYQGYEMDDIMVAKEMKKLQLEKLKDEDVIRFLTKLNHLELRVKNVAVVKLFELHMKTQ